MFFKRHKRLFSSTSHFWVSAVARCEHPMASTASGWHRRSSTVWRTYVFSKACAASEWVYFDAPLAAWNRSCSAPLWIRQFHVPRGAQNRSNFLARRIWEQKLSNLTYGLYLDGMYAPTARSDRLPCFLLLDGWPWSEHHVSKRDWDTFNHMRSLQITLRTPHYECLTCFFFFFWAMISFKCPRAGCHWLRFCFIACVYCSARAFSSRLSARCAPYTSERRPISLTTIATHTAVRVVFLLCWLRYHLM